MRGPKKKSIRPRRFFAPCAVLLVAQAVLFSEMVQLYPPIGWVDPGLYIYWFLTPIENLTLRGADYQGMRLPFILLGAALYRLMTPLVAQAALVSAFYSLGLIAIYALAACVIRTRAARLATLAVLGFNPIWIAAFTRGYVDGPAIALALSALACLLHARRQAPCKTDRIGNIALHAAAGSFVFLAMATHPFAGGVAGLASLAVLAVRPGKWNLFIGDGACMVGGAVATFFLISVAGKLLGLPFLFLFSSIMIIINQLSLPVSTAFELPAVSWVHTTHRLALVPVSIFVLLAGYSWNRSKDGSSAKQICGLLAAALMALMVIIVWLTRSTFMLQFPFYASYLFLALVPALVLFIRAVETYYSRHTAQIGIVMIGGAFGCFVVAQQLSFDLRATPQFNLIAWIAIALLFAGALLAALAGRSGLALLGIAATLGVAGASNADTANALRIADGPDNAAQHATLREFRSALNKAGVPRGRYLHWFGRENFTTARNIPASSLYRLSFAGIEYQFNALDSLVATLGWNVASVGDAMPQLDLTSTRAFHALTATPIPLVTLCADLSTCEDGFAALSAQGLIVAGKASTPIEVVGAPRMVVAIAYLSVPAEAITPAPEVVARSLAARLDENTALSRAEGEKRTVTSVHNLSCVGNPEVTTCAFGFDLSNGDRGTTVLPLTRVGATWVLAAENLAADMPPAEPDRETVKRELMGHLLAGPAAKLALRERLTVVGVKDLMCRGTADLLTCSFLFELSNGVSGKSELPFKRIGKIWIATAGAAMPLPVSPDARAVKQFFEAQLLVGLNTHLALREPLTVNEIGELWCQVKDGQATCNFTFELSTGDTGRGNLPFVWTTFGWLPALGDLDLPPPTTVPDSTVVRKAFLGQLTKGLRDGQARNRTSVDFVEVRSCSGDPNILMCRFTYRTGSGEWGTSQLAFTWIGFGWIGTTNRLSKGETPGLPSQEIVRRAFFDRIASSPRSQAVLDAKVAVADIRDLLCQETGPNTLCSFTYLLTSGETGTSQILFSRRGFIWWPLY